VSGNQNPIGHALDTSEFFEGGLNLTASGLAGKCFNTFIANTRSSTSLTATIFDFAGGRLGECTSDTVTTPSVSAPTIIPANGTLVVHDTAVITVDGIDEWTGEVSFFLCGPFALDSTTLCPTGGVPAGVKDVSNLDTTEDSNNLTVTSVGRYCWRAEFVAEEGLGVPPSSDARASECFSVTPRGSVLATAAGAGPVDFGQPVSDTATLTNTANQPGSGGPAGSTDGSINPANPGGPAGGTITFTLYKNDCTTLATGTGSNPSAAIPVSGDGSYGPVNFTPDAPGTYHWKASYTGSSPNTTGDTHNAACDDPGESVIVRTIPTLIKSKQSWYPNDTATVSSSIGNLGTGGTVRFRLYNNATCTGTAFLDQTKNVTGGTPSEELSTTNTTVAITTLYTDPPGTQVSYSWLVVYTPGAADTAHTGKKSACNAENFTITYTNDPGPGTDLP
jgi:hypothetical protein